MKRAMKIYESHVCTVSLQQDPFAVAIRNELFPLIESHYNNRVCIMEANENLSWDQIVSIFKAAQKVSGGGALQRAAATGSKLKDTINDKMIELVSKYASSEPVKDGAQKVERMSKRLYDAVLQNIPPEKQAAAVTAIKRLRAQARQVPESIRSVLAVMSTMMSYAGNENAAEIVPTIGNESADVMADYDFEPAVSSMDDINSMDTEDELLPPMSNPNTYNKQDRRAKKSVRKGNVAPKVNDGPTMPNMKQVKDMDIDDDEPRRSKAKPNMLSQILGGSRGNR